MGLDPEGPRTFTISLHLPSLERPSIVAQRLPKALIHRNVPGVMAAVNRVFSDLGVNVEAQFLQTRGELGYVVTDVGRGSSAEALAALQTVHGTIRTRVLY